MNKKSGLRFTVYGLLLMACCLPFTATAQVTVGGDVYGGGNKASVARGTKVLIDQAGAVITGDVYGGGALAKVDTALVAVAPQTPVAATSIDSTLVTILQGAIGGNVYGGGLGDSVPAPYNGTANVAAHVYGAVHVSIGDTVRTAPGGIVGSATINGYVFGGNNNNGSPKDNVRVDIWSTARTAKQAATYTNNDREYALSQVFGGGNKAAYLPSVNTKKDTVYIHTCDNTIEYVYGGGNAADVGTSTINSATEVIIDGGRIEWVFGGGNGFSSTGNHDNASAANYNPGANIYGNATVTYHSGDISYIFGGSNQWGNVTGAKTVNVLADGPCTKHIKELYGGSNEAPTTGSVALTMGCSASTCPIDAVFGGSRNADISADVVLNIEGGSYTNVFGGNNIGGTINGDVTLNLLGGTIDSAFGGNNAGGAINGKITVNMLDLEDANCPLVVHNIYGGGKNAAYTPSTPGAYPEVNLIHGSVTKDGSGNGGNVYGGGFGATAIVTSTPTVNVGYGTSMASTATALNGSALTSSTVAVAGNVFGGGEAALVTGSTTVTLQADNPGTSASTSVGGHVFGGGNLANVSNSTDVNINGGTVDSNVYGGGNLADVLHSTDVTIDGGTVTMDVYGGGALADVGTSSSDHTNVTVTSGTVTGGVYGGGLGDDDHAALVNGAVQVTVDGGTVNDVFGCNNVNGRPTSTVRVDINNNVGGNVFGGGNLATYTGDPYVYINNGTVSGNVFGGGNGDPTDNTQVKGSVTGTPHVTVGDVGVGHESYQAIVSGDVYGGGNAAKVITGTPVVLVPAKCSNNTQITSVYGGGNAADVPATSVTIHGGIIDTVFGGGHGNKDATPTPIAANVDGNTNVSITGGTIGQVFGGSNSNGTIGGTINVNIDKGNTSCDMVISAVYGGGNYAASNVGNITIGCTGTSSSEYIDTVFGGANRANITGDITLTITGGRINNAFGGNNNSGTIDGDITVNVEWDNSGCSDKYLGNVYGAGNLAPYSQKTAGHPAVNIKNGTVAKVFGGGKGASAVVTGNPVVTIGDANASYVAIVGNVYGGGDAAAVTGNTTVTYNDANASSTVDSLFGGGNAAGVSGTANVTLTSGKVTGGLFGGCNTSGTVEGTITVALNGGTVGVNGTTTDVVYGGGFGHSTATGGDVSVTLGGTTVYGNLYGGSALGSVNGSTSNTTTVTLNSATLNGSVFGGGMGSGTGAATQAATLGNVVVNHNIANSNLTGIYGGANVNGNVVGDIAVNIEANVGTDASHRLDVFGGGYGQYTTTDGNVTVTVGNSTSPAIYGNLYGGSALGEVGATGKIAKVDFKAGTLYDTIFGGGMGNNSIAAAVSGGTNVTVTTGTISGGIYGGCNLNGTVDEDITVNANGGTIGANGSPASVFGGGFGNNTATSGDVTVNINGATVWGDVYGGSGFGNVNNISGGDTTTVNILAGTVKGDVYGGGLGSTSPNYEATEYGVVVVNIGSGTADPLTGVVTNLTGSATIVGDVYGCNNTNGSPMAEVFVNIYQTAHTTTDAATYTEDDGVNGSPTYAIGNVFGGGNQADYSATHRRATVTVYTCANTIERIFGGGDAAGAEGVGVTIWGGRFDYVFGGGNGEVTAANVGEGGTRTNIHGGRINELFGGSNSQGTIAGTMQTHVSNDGPCADEYIAEFFGGGNKVPITSNIETTISCGTVFGTVYGGSNQAEIQGNVTLNIEGGTMDYVFGGSKGERGHSPIYAHIIDNPLTPEVEGNVTLNIYGGSIGTAFGGSDQNGNIAGTITVNVLDHEIASPCEVFSLGTLYGSGNLTPYSPTNAGVTNSPIVNVMHIRNGQSITGNVYGGGYGTSAEVTANPKVTIGYDASTMSGYTGGFTMPATTYVTIDGSVFGGGYAAPVTGNPVVKIQTANTSVANVYGGGNEAGISGNTDVTLAGGTVVTGIYGGCNTAGDVTGNSTVALNGGTVGSLVVPTESANGYVTGRIFGGGYGQNTNIDGNVHVTLNGATVYGDLYGGSALGDVNTNSGHLTGTVNNTDTVLVDILSGTIQGDIYGGGLGDKASLGTGHTDVAATVHGVIHVNIGAGPKAPSTDTTGSAAIRTYTLVGTTTAGGSVYGCNNTYGSPQNDVYVDVWKTAMREHDAASDLTAYRTYAIENLFGGGNAADYAPENGNASSTKLPYVHVHGCSNTIKEVFGGCNAADAIGTHLVIDGGRYNEVFGGGNGAVVAANIGAGKVYLETKGGHIGYVFGACNRQGTVLGGDANITTVEGGGDCGPLVIDYFFFGGNFADIIGDYTFKMTCADYQTYLAVYGGCRLGTVYGNLTLIIDGGTFGSVFGGSLGANDYSANVMKYPTQAQLTEDDARPLAKRIFKEEIRNYMSDPAHAALAGTGGNVTVIIRGGDIGSVFGGCDQNGNVEGNITVIIDSANTGCLFDVDYVYGASNLAQYSPDTANLIDPANPINPIVELRNGHVNYDVFGGGHGSTDNVNAGLVTSSPKVIMGSSERIDTAYLRANRIVRWISASGTDKFEVKRNIYGGGEMAQVAKNTDVTIAGDIVRGTVYGGGKGHNNNERFGTVQGNTLVTMTGGQVERSVYGGGELGSVGTFIDFYTAGNGRVADEPKTCKKGTGVAKVTISGNSLVGVINQALMPPPDPDEDDFGYIFCGSRGEVDSIHNPTANKSAIVDSTYLEIGGNALVTASAYGGCENGQVLRNTMVKITGNSQIGVGYHKEDGNHVFDDKYTPAQWTGAKPANFHEVSHWPYRAPFEVYDAYADEVGYDSHGGSTSATNGHSFYGNVFGGGSGYYAIEPDGVDVQPGTWRRSAGRVNGNTHVVVDGGHILNNLYGGNELTDVLGSITVDMSGGTLGVPRTVDSILARPVSCYLFGGGKGDGRTFFNKMTNVQSVTVNVTGGRIFGSVFGGGEDGHVLGDVTVNINLPAGDTLGTTGTSYVDGNVFGGGRGFDGTALTAGNVGGNITVNISSGKILGSVYGGGRLGSVGYKLCYPSDDCYGVMTTHADSGNIVVNITGGTIGNDDASDYNLPHSRGGNVFGGPMGRLTKLDGSMVLPLWHRLGSAKSTTVNINDNSGNTTWIKGNVYGGAEMGRVTEDIQVNISGNVTIGRKSAGTTAHGNVYGGGMGYNLTDAEVTEIDNAVTSDSIPTFAGLTGGTIKVNISGGAINNNVYGAGEMASVGTIDEVIKHTDSATTYYLSWPYEYTYHGTSGDARVNITGGKIGYRTGSTTTGGDIFGSARGTVGDRYVTGKLATARVTHVDINLAATTDTIFGTVYGSGENGHVYDSAVVTLRNGLVLGSVYGGGKGTDQYTDQLKNPTTGVLEDAQVYDIIAGKVFGNTKVNILGGRVAKNVYGGGNLASVGKGNYKKYGEGPNVSAADSLLAENSGHCYVNILGGVIGPDSILAGTTYNGSYAIPDGHVYGAGKGIVFPAAAKVGYAYNRDYYVAYVNKTFVIIGDSTLERSCDYKTVLTPHVTGNVFGGGENGHVRFDTYVQTNRGIVGVRPLDSVSSDVGHWAHRGNVWGAGRGEDLNPDGSYCQSAGSVTRNTRIDVLGGRIYRNVQGGGAMASVGPIKGRTGDSSTCVINVRLPLNSDTIGGPGGRTVTGHTAEKSFGGYIGGGSRGIPSPDGTRNDSLATCHNSQINIYQGRLKNTIYGGGENGQMLGNTEVNIYGGYIRSAIYGGGKGSWKETGYNDGHTYLNDTLSGYVAGNTEVNLLGGIVPYTYGGCRRANVGGNATINIGMVNPDYDSEDPTSEPYIGNVSFDASKRKVYGGNQYAGSPKGNIYVNVYKTAHTTTDAASYTEDDGSGAPAYAIGHVYGGSYNSDYLPNRAGRYAQVHVYGCDNTIGEVYGGGAAADVGAATPGIGADCKLIIDGGRFDKVFGGGDGTFDRYIGTPVPADIHGTATTEIHGGTIGSLFGGSNFMGKADTIRISVENDGLCGTTIEGDEFFGGSNLSNLGPTDLNTTLGCGVKFRAAYGGSNQADIIGNVTFTIEGGEFEEVYAGSKGAIVSPSARQGQKDTAEANIAGNTHLIIKGGKVGSAFGGSNINGNITGTITVDVDSTYNTTECPWNVDYVYGGSNLTQYLPNDSTVTNHSPSPLVNILCGTVNNDVYGGGKGSSTDNTAGLVQSNPQVVMSQTAKGTTWVKGSIYGGGELAITDGNTEVNISAGTVGVEGSATTNGNVYGGGRGDASKIKAGLVKRNSTVNIAGGRVWHNVYGGGSLASVGTFTYGAVDRSTNSQQITSCAPGTGLATVYISGGIIGNDGHENGMVFGSSRGDIDTILARQDTMAWAYATKVTIGDTNAAHNMTSPQIKGSVYGGGENGHVKQNAYVHIYSGQVGYQSDRADDNTKNIDKSDPTYAFRGNVYGAGCGTDKFFIKDSIAQLKIHGTINHLEKGGGYHSPTDGDHSKDSIFKVYDYNMYAGVVQGNTHVKISGGHIFHNVYGGGAMANVGTISSLVQYKDMFADGSAHIFGLSYPNNFTFVEPTGYVHIDITGGRIGTMGSYDGDVFGGARGEAGDRFKMARYGNVRTAVININMPTVDAAYALDTFDVHECITGSVYGGAENGYINDSTFVTLTNGLVGHALYGGGKGKGEYIMHNLKHQYTKSGEGGWMAGDDSTATIFSLTAGKVYGNTRVVMDGGHVVRNIYGGGNQGSVGKGNYHGGSGDYCSAGYGERLEAEDTAFWLPLFRSSGTSTVIVNDGTVGLADATIKDSLPYGNVFGGCRGTAAPNVRQTLSPRVLYYPIFFVGYSNRTRVIIGDGTKTPRIYGSVYGGGMDGHVRWGTHVTVKSGEIGLAYNAANQTAVGTDNLDRKQWFLRGSVYGAGSGLGQYEATLKHTTARAGEGGWAVGDDSVGYLYSSSAGSVTHFTRVDIEGGTIHNNVYGGGSLASVGPPMMGQRHNAPIDSSLSVINISGGTIGTFADVVGYKVIHHDAVAGVGEDPEDPGYVAPVAAYDETVHYSYGGKVFGGSRGQIDVDNASFSTVVWTQVNLSGGQAYGSVYGGGEVGTIKEDAYVNVSGGIVGPNVAVKTTGPGGDSLSCVYGGGKGIGDDPSSTYSTFTNVNNTHVAVSGGRVCGSVFGGAEDGHVLGNTNVSISNTMASSAYAAAHAGVAEGDVLSIPIIGTGGYTHEYDGCVLGGGRNALNKNASAGRVQGNTNVTVTGGRIMRTILGGGALARVGVNVDGVFKGIGAGNDTISFKDNSGNYDSINHGTTFVQVSGDTLLVPSANFGNVFVDGRTYRDIFSGTVVLADNGDSVVYLTTIGAPNGPILVDNDYTIGDIFGGGKGDTKDTVDIMAGRVMNTYVTVSGRPRIMADIYAGGEMSSVGWWDTNRYVGTYGTSDPNTNHDKYYAKTGYTHVSITGNPYTGTPYEFSTDNYIDHRKAWTLVDGLGRLTHTCSGNVYGGGQGYVEQDATHYWNWVHMGRVRRTIVTIGDGRFMGNVFGGGSRGVVKEDCNVTITGGRIGCLIDDASQIEAEDENGNPIMKDKYVDRKYAYGSVFGGGYGNPKTFSHLNDSSFVTSSGTRIPMIPTEQAGRVYGNTHVNISGGQIYDCVFGGGDMASTGWVERDPTTGAYIFDDSTKRHGGVCYVNITGTAIVGPLDYNGQNAYVYGAGKGVSYDPDETYKNCANVNRTHLTVSLGNTGRIWGSIFGGGADCHVLGDVHTTLHAGLIGTRGVTSYDGNIFGAGRNYQNSNHTNGRVQGNVYVLMDGGSLKGTIFGGGRMALTGIDVDGHFPTTGWPVDEHGNVDIQVRAGAVIGTSHTDSLLMSDESCGDIFGSGKGDILNYEDVWAGRVTNTKITVKDSLGASPRIYGAVFGGGEMASVGWWDDTITDGSGNIVFHTNSSDFTTPGTTYGTNWTIIYAGTGTSEINISGNVTVGSSLEYTVNPADNPGDWTIYNSAQDTLIHTCTGNVFGGCQGDVNVLKPRWISMGRSASTVVNISGGNFMGNVFGGSEQGIVTGDTRVNISGGTFGIDGLGITPNSNLDKYYSGDIYAAGYGSDDPAEWDDDTPNDSTAASIIMGLGWETGLLSGRTFGNSRVDITGGTIYGSVYGGGSYASVGDDKPMSTVEPYASLPVNGVTTVNIGLPGAQPDGSDATGSATILGEVFGGNNFKGTPYGNTEVHIYSTAHTLTDTCPTADYTKALAAPDTELTEEDVNTLPHNDNNFALKAVYGGGNHAAHTPLATDGTTNVYVHYCDENTIRDVYGGGNAADTKNNHIVIEGGRIYEVFGGGNGAGEGNPGANVVGTGDAVNANGTAWTQIHGGLITDVFGGSNSKGNIGQTILDIEKDGDCDMMVANTYGGGNEAVGGGGVINLYCGTNAGNFYGGSRNADLVGDVVLNIYGGTYENVFGGSKGRAAQAAVGEPGDPEYQPAVAAKAANITGNVTVNVFGGNIQNLYGGSDICGNITGKITVNIDLDSTYDCPDGLRLDKVYGGGNLAVYFPTDPTLASPEINIINDSAMGPVVLDRGEETERTERRAKTFGIQTVFGGGFGDGTTHTYYTKKPSDGVDTLRGQVFANPVVNVGGIDLKWDKTEGPMGDLVADGYRRNIAIVRGNIYGGGQAAPVEGDPRVTLYSSRITELDGSGNPVEAEKDWDTTAIHGSVFGGGYGQTAVVTGNTTVGIFGDATVVLGNVYGGGEASITNGNTDVMVGYDVIAMPIISIDDHGKVTITCSTPDVTIYYTTDGTVPNNKGNGTVYEGPFTPAESATVRAIAYKTGYPPSLPTYPMHTFAPTITINSSHVATLKMPTEHADATIYYTLNGDTPTGTSSSVASGGTVSVASGEVLKAIAIRPGYASSKVAMLTCATPVIEIDRAGKAKVTCATAGATIRYTLGVDPADPVAWSGTELTGGTVTVPSGQTLKVIADRPGYQPSEVAVGVYSSVPAPTFTVDPVNFTVSITSATGDIHYTDNGNVPTAESDPYTAMLTDMAGKTVKAIAVVGTTVSSIAVLAPTATPTFQNTPYTDGDQVTITCSDAGSTIYYSTDGGSTYTAGTTGTSSASFTATGGTTLKAYAYKQGMNVSAFRADVNVALCTGLATPTITVSTTPLYGTNFEIASTDDGVTLYYTTDGSTPTTSSTIYTERIAITPGITNTIKAIAARTGCENSAVAEETYCYIPDPSIDFDASGNFTITTVTGATVWYTTDGSTPEVDGATSTQSTAGHVSDGTTVKAIAVKDGCISSNVVSNRYCNVATPVVHFVYDSQEDDWTFYITHPDMENVTIWFTTDETTTSMPEPTANYGTRYTEGSTVSFMNDCDIFFTTGYVKAIAIRNSDNCTSSVTTAHSE